MKKISILIIVLLALGAGTWWFYRYYIPNIIANAIVSEDLPDYLPAQLQRTIEAARAPVGGGAEDVVREIHEAGIPLDKILTIIDNTTEEQAYSILNDLNKAKLKSTDEVFDIVKKHLKADFDLEVLRKPFNDNTNLKMIEKALAITNNNRQTKEANIETVKTITKKVLIEKEKELRAGID